MLGRWFSASAITVFLVWSDALFYSSEFSQQWHRPQHNVMLPTSIRPCARSKHVVARNWSHFSATAGRTNFPLQLCDSHARNFRISFFNIVPVVFRSFLMFAVLRLRNISLCWMACAKAWWTIRNYEGPFVTVLFEFVKNLCLLRLILQLESLRREYPPYGRSEDTSFFFFSWYPSFLTFVVHR